MERAMLGVFFRSGVVSGSAAAYYFLFCCVVG